MADGTATADEVARATENISLYTKTLATIAADLEDQLRTEKAEADNQRETTRRDLAQLTESLSVSERGKSQIESLHAGLQASYSQLAKKLKHTEESTSGLICQLEGERDKAVGEAKSAAEQLVGTRQTILNLEQDNKELKRVIHTLENRITQKHEQNHELCTANTALETQCRKVLTQADVLKRDFTKQNGLLRAAQADWKKLQVENSALKDKCNVLGGGIVQIRKLENELRNVGDRFEVAQAENEKSQSENGALRDSCNALEAQVKKLEHGLRKQEDASGATQASIDELQSQNDALKKDLRDQGSRFLIAQADIKKLRNDNAALDHEVDDLKYKKEHAQVLQARVRELLEARDEAAEKLRSACDGHNATKLKLRSAEEACRSMKSQRGTSTAFVTELKLQRSNFMASLSQLRWTVPPPIDTSEVESGRFNTTDVSFEPGREPDYGASARKLLKLHANYEPYHQRFCMQPAIDLSGLPLEVVENLICYQDLPRDGEVFQTQPMGPPSLGEVKDTAFLVQPTLGYTFMPTPSASPPCVGSTETVSTSTGPRKRRKRKRSR